MKTSHVVAIAVGAVGAGAAVWWWRWNQRVRDAHLVSMAKLATIPSTSGAQVRADELDLATGQGVARAPVAAKPIGLEPPLFEPEAAVSATPLHMTPRR